MTLSLSQPTPLYPAARLDERQRQSLLKLIRLYEGLTADERPDDFSVHRRLPLWSTELGQRAETQAETRAPEHFDPDVLEYLLKVLGFCLLYRPQGGQDNPAYRLLELIKSVHQQQNPLAYLA